MSTLKPLKVAIIGCGTISHIYMTNIKEKFAILDLVACADLIDERAQNRADEFGLKKLTNAQILADESIDLVINLTTPQSHFEVCRDILNAGKHCVVEKMMAVNYQEAELLCKLAEEKKLMFGSAPDTFLGGGWQTVRKYIDDGMIGKPMSVNAVITCSYQPVTATFDIGADHFFFPLHPGGGLPYDLGGYYLHNMINLFGRVKRVSGFGGNIDHKRKYVNPHHPKYGEDYIVNTPTSLTGILEFESGVLGSLLISSDSSVYDTFTIQGTEANMKVFHPNFFSGSIFLERSGAIADEEKEIGMLKETGYRPIPDRVELPILHGYCDNNRGLGVADMAYAIKNNRKPRMHYSIGLHAMEIIHGMLESAETGKTYFMHSQVERPKMRRTGVEIGTAQENTLDD